MVRLFEDDAMLEDPTFVRHYTNATNKPVQTEAPKKKKKGGISGFLSSLVSEGGAIGGGASGAALGSALGPIGTLVGGAIGAGVGGFGGRIAENKIRDNRLGIGDAAKEGAISAVFGASPIRALKGAGAATSAVIGGAEKGAAKIAAEEAIAKPGILSKLTKGVTGKLGTSAERLESRVTGLGVGEKIGGQKLTPQESKRLLQIAMNEGMPLGHPDTKAKFITDKLDEVGKAIDKNVGKANRVFKDKERLAVVNGFADRMEKNAVLRNNPSAQKLADELKVSLSEIDDFKSAVKAKRDFQDQINFMRNNASSTPKTEAIYKEVTTVLDDLIGGLNPKLKTLNGRYSDLSKVKEGVLNAAGKLANSSEAGGGGILGKLITGDTAQSAKSTLGRGGMAAIGAGEQAVNDALALKVPGQGVGGFASRILAGKALTSPPQPEESQSTSDLGLEDTGQSDLTQTDSSLDTSQETSDDPFATENVQSSVQKILAQGGDMKDVAAYLSNAKMLQELTTSTSKPVKKTEGQRARDEAAQLTDQALSQLEKGSVNTGLFSGKIEGLKGIVGKADPETLDFNTTVSSLKAAIAKARAGTSFTPNEEKMLNRYAPSVGDSGQVLKAKLKALQKVYAAAAEREYGTEYQPDLVTQGATL